MLARITRELVQEMVSGESIPSDVVEIAWIMADEMVSMVEIERKR